MPIRGTLSSGSCEEAASQLQTFFTEELGFAFETNSVSCSTGNGNGNNSGRKLLQRSEVRMTANTAGPGASGVIIDAFQRDSSVYGPLQGATSGAISSLSAQDTTPAPAPPAVEQQRAPQLL